MSNFSDCNPISLDFSSEHLDILENWRTANSDDISLIKEKTLNIIKFFSISSPNIPSSIKMSPVFSRPYIVLHVEDNTGIKYSTVILLHSKVAKIFLHKFHEIYNIENNSYKEDSYTKEGKKYVEENNIRNEFTTLRYPQVYEDFSILATKYNDIFLIRSDKPFEKILIKEINNYVLTNNS